MTWNCRYFKILTGHTLCAVLITDVLLLQDYISQCVGVHIVGYATMAYGLIASLSGFLTGKVYLAYLPRYVVATMTCLMTLALLTFLLVWEREPSYVFIFVFISLWGVADGQWNTFAPSKTTIVICVAYSNITTWSIIA